MASYLEIGARGENTRSLDRFDVVADDVGFGNNGRVKVGLFRRDNRMRFGERKEAGISSVTKRLDCIFYMNNITKRF